jgi:hypothetical protein
MSAPALPRPHRRAARQLLVGLAPLVVVAVVLLVVLSVRLAEAQAPLARADATATATVVADDQPPDRRGVSVTFTDAQGASRSGVLVFPARVDAAPGAPVAVQYDPASPAGDTVVYADRDTAHAAVSDVLFGLVVTVLLLVVAVVVTGLRLLSRRRLRRRPAGEATASRVVVRQGLFVRSWLELVTPRGIRWVPVHWAPELARLAPDSRIEVRGDPARDRLLLPVVAGAEIWPSGRVRERAPRGEHHVAAADPGATDVGWGRQVRADVVVAVAAPLLGLLWAYVDGSGVAGFVLATVMAAAVLFWLPQLLGSDPDPPQRTA